MRCMETPLACHLHRTDRTINVLIFIVEYHRLNIKSIMQCIFVIQISEALEFYFHIIHIIIKIPKFDYKILGFLSDKNYK